MIMSGSKRSLTRILDIETVKKISYYGLLVRKKHSPIVFSEGNRDSLDFPYDLNPSLLSEMISEACFFNIRVKLLAEKARINT